MAENEQTPPSDAGVNTNEPQANAEAQAVGNKEATAEKTSKDGLSPDKLGILNDVAIAISIEVGRSQIKIRDLLNLTKGSIIELNKMAGDPVDVYANGRLISTGNIITANGKYCVRLLSMPESGKISMDPNHK
ncbi:MAG: flagellar motor switch protein FliN [Gammaproteobacteria bacterium]